MIMLTVRYVKTHYLIVTVCVLIVENVMNVNVHYLMQLLADKIFLKKT